MPVGLHADGALAIPDDVHTVGWWTGGSKAGEAFGSVVVAGHVDSAAQGIGVFAALRRLTPGQVVELDGGGHAMRYRIISATRCRRPRSPRGPGSSASTANPASSWSRAAARSTGNGTATRTIWSSSRRRWGNPSSGDVASPGPSPVHAEEKWVARTPDGPPPEPPVQRLRLRYAKRGRLRFASHRDFQRSFERALRRADVPMAYSAGFSPHPRISYANAAPTGAASEAEYVEIAVTARCDPERLRAALDGALPPGLDVVEVVEARTPGLAERLEASVWRIELPGVEPAVLQDALAAFLAADGGAGRAAHEERRPDLRRPGRGGARGGPHG